MPENFLATGGVGGGRSSKIISPEKNFWRNKISIFWRYQNPGDKIPATTSGNLPVSGLSNLASLLTLLGVM
jgi:hypothetical protein